jgi:hypothetical protein
VKVYESEFFEGSSWASALRLLDSADVDPGVVLDLGSGRSPLAGRLAALGFTPVACDIDPDAVADLTAQNVEAHLLSLTLGEKELVAELARILDGRRVAAVLALDVLEHLTDPASVLRALRTLALDSNPGVPLIISIPNITHIDIASKLLVGRWDVIDTGLLDDTHIRFFSNGELSKLVARGGWVEEANDDVLRDSTEQNFPSDTPSLRPGTPLRETMNVVRSSADGHGRTFQFVRRLAVGEVRSIPVSVDYPETRVPLGVVVVMPDDAVPGSADQLLGDIAGQEDFEIDVVVVGPEGIESALRSSTTRWVSVLDHRTRLTRDWAATVVDSGLSAAGQVLGFEFVVLDDDLLAGLGPEPLDLGVMKSTHGAGRPDPFDLLHCARPVFVSADSYVVPAELSRTNGVVPDGEPGSVQSLGAWIARAANLAGIVLVGNPTVAVARSTLADAGTVHEHVVSCLDREPMILPAGSASRLAGTSKRILVDERKAELYANQLHRLDAQMAAERAELAKLRAAHYRQPSRRLIAFLRATRRNVRRLLRAG